jgi:predicted membrane protein
MKMKTSITEQIVKAAAVLALMTILVPVDAQEFKISKSSGKLEIKEVNHVTIEGYSGNEIVFTSLDGPHEKDKRAEGLRAVSNMGLEDNTGLGLAVIDKGNSVEVYQLKKMDGPKVKIQVPKGISVSYLHTSPYGDDVRFKNVESEIEVSTTHNSVHLENLTGPITVKTVHGDIEADFNAAMKSPISIASVHGLVDVTIPQATKANVEMKTEHGEIFVHPDVKIDFENQAKEGWVTYGSNKIKGKINGGGLDITLSTPHGNIYLRKK